MRGMKDARLSFLLKSLSCKSINRWKQGARLYVLVGDLSSLEQYHILSENP